jgi:hypothetical protein
MALLQRDIERAQRETRSHAEAARFLNVAFTTYKKYARAYSLYDTDHKNPSGKGISKLKSKGLFGLEEIFEGKHPNYDRHKLKERMIRAGYLPNECSICAHNKQRPDGRGPYTLDYIDGNRLNLQKDNLQLICFNCQYLTTGRISLIPELPTSFSDADYTEILDVDELERLRDELSEN